MPNPPPVFVQLPQVCRVHFQPPANPVLLTKVREAAPCTQVTAERQPPRPLPVPEHIMPVNSVLPLVLGGHSFIDQLGNEPRPSSADQVRIVEACLDRGIRWFDTTYRPERIALGAALATLGRRHEATLLAWNFFTSFGPGEPVGGADYYRSEHLGEILDDLQTDYLDGLVVHPLIDPALNAGQEELAVSWHASKMVRSLGIWAPGADLLARGPGPYTFMVHPLNIATPDDSRVFLTGRSLGWRTLATSPFVRGWELDKIVAKAIARGETDETVTRARLADAMLRYSLFHPGVDNVIVAMRRPEWVQRNAETVLRGPLTQEEGAWLESLRMEG